MKALLLFSLFIAFSAQAACPEMAKKALGPKKKTYTVNQISYRAFGHLLKEYRSRYETDWTVQIESVVARFKGNVLTGYEVKITDGGDESTMRFVTNAERKPVVVYWYNQSPYTYWFCGTNAELDANETVDGEEIF
jgi:hypothetical protein